MGAMTGRYHRCMQLFDANTTRAALPFDRLIAALRERFAGGCEVPPRHVHEINSPISEGGDAASRRMTSLIMPAWLPGKYYGVKIVNIAPGNAKRGLPGLHSSYLLFDARTGAPLAQIDGDQITERRTAAASALAASYLAPADAKNPPGGGAGGGGPRLPPATSGSVDSVAQLTMSASPQAAARSVLAKAGRPAARTWAARACASLARRAHTVTRSSGRTAR